MENRDEKIFLVSDAHFGSDDSRSEDTKRRRLISFLDYVRENGDRLIILGDLFDFWFEYRNMVEMSQFPVLASLWQLSQNGVHIDYYLGNHDYWTTGFFSNELALSIHKSPGVETLGHKKTLLAHGDGLTGDEKGYLFMRRILRHPISHYLFKLLHPDIGAWLARQTSRASRRRIEQKREKASTILREYARRQLETGSYDWIITGHSHQPEKSAYGNGIYLNIGDWSEHFTYGFINGEEIDLRTWGER
jgi:UDP-2,3-diacylglucosamine hydrolase